MSLPFLYSTCHHLKCNDLYYLLRFSISIIECVYMLSDVYLSVTPWTIAHWAPLSMGLSRQEYWSGLPFLSPGDLPDPGIEPRFPTLQADEGSPKCPLPLHLYTHWSLGYFYLCLWIPIQSNLPISSWPAQNLCFSFPWIFTSYRHTWHIVDAQ